MTPPGALTVRLALLGLVVVVVQTVAISQIDLLGTNADVLPISAAAVGLLCGPIQGSVYGFACGLLLDAALVQTLGPTSLIACVVGYAAGRAGDRLDDPRGPIVSLGVGAAATTVAQLGYAGLQFLLGNTGPVSSTLILIILASIVVNTLISLPAFAIVRRVLGGAIPADRRPRRRRVYAASLSPLHRA